MITCNLILDLPIGKFELCEINFKLNLNYGIYKIETNTTFDNRSIIVMYM